MKLKGHCHSDNAEADLPPADAADKRRHETICMNIIEDQKGRRLVKESQQECINEITDHLKLHLYENSGACYEDWIAGES